MDEWHKRKIKHPVFVDPDDTTPTIIDVPFWKCSHQCYLDILLLCCLMPEDYPWEIGPYPCPLTWVSYMESTFQFSFCFQTSHYITSHPITSDHILLHTTYIYIYIVSI